MIYLFLAAACYGVFHSPAIWKNCAGVRTFIPSSLAFASLLPAFCSDSQHDSRKGFFFFHVNEMIDTFFHKTLSKTGSQKIDSGSLSMVSSSR